MKVSNVNCCSRHANLHLIHWLLMLLFLSLLFLTPYGFEIMGNVIWFTDITVLIVGYLVFAQFVLGHAKIKLNSYRFSFSLLFLFLFFLLEFLLPMFGIVVWNDISSGSSGLRALIYWLPFIGIFIIRPFSNEDSLLIVDRLLFFTVICNVVFGFVELAIYFEKIPEFLNFRLYLTDFAPQERFNNNRMMSFGFFQNSTAYGVFGFITFSHFLSRLLQTDSNKLKLYFFTFLSLLIIVLSTSRVPLAASIISFSLFFFFQRKTKWNLAITTVLLIFGTIMIMILFTSDFLLFSRFTRLIEGGLLNDYSLNKRVTVLWPNALNFYYELGHPTFTNPTKYTGTVDSGYFTYLLQGGLLMLITLLGLLGVSILSPLKKIVLSSRRNYFSYFLIFLGVYVAIGMLISNPMRNPIVIAFFCYAVFGFSSRNKLRVPV